MQSQVINALIRYVAIAVMAGILGWTIGHRGVIKLENKNLTATVKVSEGNREKEKELQAKVDTQAVKINQLETKANENIVLAEAENYRLRTCIANGTCGLRYTRAPSCPTASAGQAATSGAGDGTPGELDAITQQNYFALRQGIEREAEKLTLCQSYIRETQ